MLMLILQAIVATKQEGDLLATLVSLPFFNNIFYLKLSCAGFHNFPSTSGPSTSSHNSRNNSPSGPKSMNAGMSKLKVSGEGSQLLVFR